MTASLLTTLLSLVIAGGTAALALVYLRPRPRVQQAAAAGAGAELVAQIVRLVHTSPRTAAFGAALVGLLIGATPELRRALGDAINPKPRPKTPREQGRP